MIPFVDAASPPSFVQAQQASAEGYRAAGFYLNGTDGDEDPLITWTPAQVGILFLAHLQPLPIWVPNPSLASDPAEAAFEAYQSAKKAGLNPTTAILYNGNHIPASGPQWHPIPGNRPSSLDPGTAVQFSSASISGWNVNLNVASNDFPLGNGLVCDFEFNTTKNPAWYATFQQTIASLGKGVVVALNKPVVGGVSTVDGKGYYMVAADGGVFTFGSAKFFGSLAGKNLAAPIVGMAPTPTGLGYWLFGADGGAFTFGDALFYGSISH